ncbi:MAG: NUDIX domain-containing protein [Bacilli bacterium]
MKQEYSYGAVVYKKDKEEILFLIEHMALGHISLPKGHIEKGETPLQCTLREIKEETGLDVIVDQSFSHKITYSPANDIIKDVVFFLATPKTSSLIPQKEEVNSLEWLPFEKALEILTYKTDKDTLTDAYSHLREH